MCICIRVTCAAALPLLPNRSNTLNASRTVFFILFTPRYRSKPDPSCLRRGLKMSTLRVGDLNQEREMRDVLRSQIVKMSLLRRRERYDPEIRLNSVHNNGIIDDRRLLR